MCLRADFDVIRDDMFANPKGKTLLPIDIIDAVGETHGDAFAAAPGDTGSTKLRH